MDLMNKLRICSLKSLDVEGDGMSNVLKREGPCLLFDGFSVSVFFGGRNGTG